MDGLEAAAMDAAAHRATAPVLAVRVAVGLLVFLVVMAALLLLTYRRIIVLHRTARQSPEDKAPATTRATTATSSTTSASGGGLSRSASFLALLDQRCQALLSAVVPEEIVLARDVEAEDMEEGIVMLAKQTAPPVEEALERAEVSPAVVASPTATETPPASSEPQARASSTHRRRKHKSAAKQKPAADTAVPSVALEPPTQSASPPVSSTEVSAAPSPTLSTCHHEDDEDMLSSFTPNDAIPSTCVLPPNLRSPMRPSSVSSSPESEDKICGSIVSPFAFGSPFTLAPVRREVSLFSPWDPVTILAAPVSSPFVRPPLPPYQQQRPLHQTYQPPAQFYNHRQASVRPPVRYMADSSMHRSNQFIV